MGMAFMPLGSLDDLRRHRIDLIFARACLVEPWPTDAASLLRCGEAKRSTAGAGNCRLVGQILADWQLQLCCPLAMRRPCRMSKNSWVG